MNNETKMWLELLRNANPDWRMSVGLDWKAGEALLSCDCLLYLVDVASGWSLAGTTTSASMRGLAARLRENPHHANGLTGACAFAIREASTDKVIAGTREAESLLTLAVAAITQCATWTAVQQQRGTSLSGHWVCMAYRLRDGSVALRPAFAAHGPRATLLAPADFYRLLRTLIAQDLAGHSTTVGKMIAGGGGLCVAREFELIRPEA